MLIFKKVKYKNFLSVGNQPIEIILNKSPTTVITGQNGSGKSSALLDTIHFALFGKAFRNINKPALVNSINGGNCVVELEFSVGQKEYKIVRGIKPTVFEIYENTRLVNQDAASRDYQQYLIDNILGGLNETVFKQVVVIGSADYRPFMQLSASSRREVIEELLDIKIFSSMLDLAKDKMSALKESLADMDYHISICEEKIRLQKENKNKIISSGKEKISDLNLKIATEEKKIESINISIQEYQSKKDAALLKLSGFDILEKAVSDLDKLLHNLKHQSGGVSSNIDFFESKHECPTCLQQIQDHHKSKILDDLTAKQSRIVESIEKVEKSLSEKRESLSKFQKISKLISQIDAKIYQLQSDISFSNKYIKTLVAEIDSISNQLSETHNADTALENELIVLKNKRVEYLEQRQYYDVVCGLLKDGGIKTKIIKQYIPLMNSHINGYLNRLGLPIEFTLDEQFNEVIKSRYRDAFSYANFSEGEKARIDTALLLAWRQIAKSKNTINCNLLILDEVLDGHLDNYAREELVNILMEMGKGTNIFVISHVSADQLVDKFRSVIVFEKQGNFSRIKTEK